MTGKREPDRRIGKPLDLLDGAIAGTHAFCDAISVMVKDLRSAQAEVAAGRMPAPIRLSSYSKPEDVNNIAILLVSLFSDEMGSGGGLMIEVDRGQFYIEVSPLSKPEGPKTDDCPN